MPRRVDQTKIADFLCQMHGDASRSYFEGVSRLEPAHLLIADQTGVRTKRYYDLKDHIRPIHYGRDDDYVEAAQEHLSQAIRPLLRSTGGIRAMMIGGRDSPVVAIKASGLMDAPLPVFTSIPEFVWDGRTTANAYGDETDFVQQTCAAHPKLDLNTVDASGLGQYDDQVKLLFYCEMPLRSALNVSWTHEILRKAKAKGITTMLHGGLGNATFSYDGEGLYNDLWQSRQFGRLFAELKASGLRMAIGFAMPDWAWWLNERIRGRGSPGTRWQRYSALRKNAAKYFNIKHRANVSGFTFFARKSKRV